jgi:hypothetical protein
VLSEKSAKKKVWPTCVDFLGRTFQKRTLDTASPPRKMADKTDKGTKRKRSAKESSKPSKKAAIEDGNVKISLQDSGQWAPIIGMDTLTSRQNPSKLIVF